MVMGLVSRDKTEGKKTTDTNGNASLLSSLFASLLSSQ
jgi:hypothetical protein